MITIPLHICNRFMDVGKNLLTFVLYGGKMLLMKTTFHKKIEDLGGYQTVAELLGIDTSTVWRHLQGRKPTLENIIKYKDLGIVPEDFIDRETEKQETDQ